MAIAFGENYSHVQIRNWRQLYMISAGENGLPKQDIGNNWGCPEVPVSGVFYYTPLLFSQTFRHVPFYVKLSLSFRYSYTILILPL